ncbi:14483_t:CDS:2 [Cetraspora pellucida]|uniref:14483_t:CDS:1 n=1 Tax=Cetraspora pellucida TaxID=1433469 RepID=A0A9N9FGI0_9GLOM|nr:14483_t:CDS:2 [Cetraspora pellucida]
MNTSTGTSLSVFSAVENFILQRPQRQRRRSNSSNDILAHVSVKAVRSPRRDASYNNIPRPPRLAYDTSSQAFASIMPRTPPPSRQVYARPEYGPPQTHTQYRNEINTTYRSGSSPSRGSRTTSFGSSTSGSSRMSVGSQQVPSSLSAFYNERIEKTTSFDDEDSAGEETMSCNSPIYDDYDEAFIVDSSLAQEVYLLRKEIDAVKNSLAGLQKNRVDTLNEKKQLEQQYQEAKSEVTRTLEISINDSLSFKLELSQSQLEKSKRDFRDLLTVKEKIEISFETQEREYCERIRQFEAVISHRSHNSRSSISFLAQQRQQSGLSSIPPRDHNRSQSKSHSKQKSINDLTAINDTGSAGSTGSGSCLDGEKRKSGQLKDITRTINQMEHCHSSELMPSYCLSPPRTRIQSYANPALLFTDEERVRHHTRFSLAKRWVEDDEVSECQQAGCLIKFNWWNRRHHCRSAFSMLLFPDGSEDWGGVWSRVCEGCFKNT